MISTSQLGIVIPTHNRCAALLECLTHLEQQTFKDFEVVVVDDGSTDSTPLAIEKFQSTSFLRLKYVRQKNSGPAKARNLGVSLLSSPICLFIGDDIFASESLVERHLRLHQEEPEIKVVALGLTRWNTSAQTVTRFMRWLDEANVQFAYPLLRSGAQPGWRHFYTSNLSLKTELLRRFPFDEQFPYAAAEDSELGYRIAKCFGLDVRFLPEALAEHLHPTTFLQSCRRMVRVGYSFGLFYELWPEQESIAGGRRHALIANLARRPHLLKWLTTSVDWTSKLICPNPLIPFVMDSHFEVGLQRRRKI